MPIVSYPYDPTGVAATNLVVREPHVLSEINSASKRTLVPYFAPFYQNNFVLEYKDMNGNYTPLILGTDYDMGLRYVGASVALAKMIYGGAVVHTEFAEGMIYLTYQTLGGPWVADRNVVLERIGSMVYNPRIATFDQLTNVQQVFPPIPHTQELMQFVGLEGLIESINGIGEALATPGAPPALWTQQQILAWMTQMTEMETRVVTLEQRVTELENPV